MAAGDAKGPASFASVEGRAFRHMRILMLGNSFTSAHGLPERLAELLDAEVVAHTRGGARLAEQMNPTTRLGGRTLAALDEGHWDYVVLQEMSNGPVKTRGRFLETVLALCERVRIAAAVPVLYETWAYEKGSERLAKAGLSYKEMHAGLSGAYEDAARCTHALLAPVGDAFFERAEREQLYDADGAHPSERGAELAAQVIAETIQRDAGLA